MELNQLNKKYPVWGIDISHWQGSLDFNKVRNAGATFVIVKATEGITFKDHLYYDNITRAKAAGLVVGSYHYFHPSQSGIGQANEYWRTIKDGMLDMPPCIDFETSDNKSATVMMKEVSSFMTDMTQYTKKNCIMYSRSGLIASWLNSAPWLAKYPFWEAEYSGLPDNTSVAKPFTYWTFWQFTDKLAIPGCPVLDGDYFYGSIEQFKEFIGGAYVPPIIPPIPPIPPIVEDEHIQIIGATSLNMRADPSLAGRIICTLPNGSVLEKSDKEPVTDGEGIVWQPVTAYVSKKYTKDV